MHDDTERWQRLTILDILCLFPAFALGAATVRFFMNHITPDPVNRPWPIDATPFSLIFVALVLGSVYAAPLSLAVQLIFRRRRTMPSIGEWLWLEPLLLYILLYVCSNLFFLSEASVLLAIILQPFSSIMALLMIGFYTMQFFKKKEIRWTDFFGCISCGSFGIMIVYLETYYPTFI